MTALDEITAAVCRSGDGGARIAVQQVVAELGAGTAARIFGPEREIGRGRLVVRIDDLLIQHGDSISDAHLLTYLASVLREPACKVRAVIDEEVAAGHYQLEWANPADDLRHTLSFGPNRRPGPR